MGAELGLRIAQAHRNQRTPGLDGAFDAIVALRKGDDRTSQFFVRLGFVLG